MLDEVDFEQARVELVETLQRENALHDSRVLEALLRVPRHRFVPERERDLAYADRALPLAAGQTISQPSMVALMLQALRCEPQHRVLEVGSGSGYVLALLAELCARVYGIERLPELAERSRQTLATLGYRDVVVIDGDGTQGLPEAAPFDRILVSAAAGAVPRALIEELGPSGRIVVPVGGSDLQVLRIGQRDAHGLHWSESVHCRFVPLVGS